MAMGRRSIELTGTSRLAVAVNDLHTPHGPLDECHLRSSRAAAYRRRPSSSPIDVQLDDVAIGVGDIQLLPRRDVVGALETLDAMRAEMLPGALVVRDAKRHVPVTGIDRP